jgi:glycerol-3-phosphate acyltransferase PlsX
VTTAMTIALDTMGGDSAPGMVVDGAATASRQHPEVRFLLFGDEAAVSRLLAGHPRLSKNAEIRHAPEVVRPEDKPSHALRRLTQSSMRLAIDSIKSGEAQAVVSAGNTGALMAISKIVLKTQDGIDRPAMISYFPTIRGESSMVDLGANIECDARNLVQFAIMGAAFARSVLGIERPSVGLLNVGEEELKGSEEVRAANRILKNSVLDFDYHGFVEGNNIGEGLVDVFVTDGFTGNAVLKTTEGTAKMVKAYLIAALKRSWASRLGYLLAKPALDAFAAKLDPRQYDGAMFVGLNGVVVKSHGSTDAEGFANAVGVAIDMTKGEFNERIHANLEMIGAQTEPADQAEQAALT